MPSILIVYDSKTGNTEKMAYAIAEGVKRVEQIGVEVKRVTDTRLDDLLLADGIIVVLKFGSTQRDIVKGLIDITGRDKILGIIVNMFDIRSASYYGPGKYKKYGKYYS